MYSLSPDRTSQWGVLLEHLSVVEAKSQTSPPSQNKCSLNSLRCWALHDAWWSISPARKTESIPICPHVFTFICLCGLTKTSMNVKSVKTRDQIHFFHMKKTVSPDASSHLLLLHIHQPSHPSLYLTKNNRLSQITFIQSSLKSCLLYGPCQRIQSHHILWCCRGQWAFLSGVYELSCALCMQADKISSY